MGVDIPDIRQIIHWGMPATLEEEVGRAGRDGNHSVGILYEGNRAKNLSALAKEYEANSSVCRQKHFFKCIVNMICKLQGVCVVMCVDNPVRNTFVLCAFPSLSVILCRSIRVQLNVKVLCARIRDGINTASSSRRARITFTFLPKAGAIW